MSFTYINLIGVILFVIFCHYVWLIEAVKHFKSERDYYKERYYYRLEFDEPVTTQQSLFDYE